MEIIPSNFIEEIIVEDLKSGKVKSVITRFPPEPNGYLHIGHAKSICLNFGLALKFNGRCNLRFDDTNPEKEDTEYVESIKRDVKWLGFDWGEKEFYASDYFDFMYEMAIKLIKMGKAYVCHLSPEEMRRYRGTLTEPGINSPYRDRSIEENLELFEKMRRGEFEEGEAVLRAKIDMSSPNINLRDPVMYRIIKQNHHRTGNKWCIYPSYDWAHGLEDSIEGVTHSICTLEFEDHRPLYDWFLDQLGVYHPQQIEFARLNLTYTVMSKRKLLKLVEDGYVSGWDDPRMPTISGLRRRGYTPESIRKFAEMIGVAKSNSVVDYGMLEFCIREDLNKRAQRVMVVINPVKLIITNYPDGKKEMMEAVNNPEDESMGKRLVPFSKVLYVEREDFSEEPDPKFFRLAPGKEVRLQHGYYVTCTGFKKGDDGNIEEIYCTYDPDSRGGWTKDGRKVKGTIHWVSAEDAIDIEVRMYSHLFTKENPDDVEEGKNFTDYINPDSLKIFTAKGEPFIKDCNEEYYQFLRNGYFRKDEDSTKKKPVFNKTVGLKDSWSKGKK
ncbi:glutamine--tRNA ligase/YqeY domain fusion protein [Calditerrivibrio nitroreducens]|uniref:Glutamine--tRNA ligase n=1 Tax=Calditerrivibrio nitroreducens (strain DSM 19672 / NBRC 101217 / Yu37-1) TaxID=768670 RepID=E4TJJ9_CALNY|nr:glutamine--tRNA ligase/YqeY domain fusion protein [Calditerrivibrio nitroreducens]ADR18161.1 glutaminyl-tRNA synthetase [Calditerrivibrio nitroreducens DSM 19672]